MKTADFEILAKKYAMQRAFIGFRMMPWFLLPIIIGLVLGSIIENHYKLNKMKDIVTFVLGVIGFFCFALFGLRNERRLERNAGYHCPNCGKQIALHKDVVVASGNCPFCGKKALDTAEQQMFPKGYV